MTIVVNGRFLANTHPAGVHRAGRSLIDGLRVRGVPLEVLAPSGTTDDRVTRTIPSLPGQVGLQLWEQVELVAAAGRRPMLSLANTGPMLARTHVLFFYDLASQVGPQWFRAGNTAYMRFIRQVALQAKVVVVPAHQVARELTDTGFHAGRIAVVPLAVDPSFAPADAAAIARVRARLGLDRKYVLHVGWGDPRKNVGTAVAAHLKALEQRPHDLVLVGEPHPYFVPVSVPPGPSIRRVGRVSDDELVALMTGASALLYPSLYEGFGLPPLEAAACATPAVVSDIPVLRETVGRGATFLPPLDVSAWADAIRAALDDALAVGSVSRWSWDDAAGALADVLERYGIR